CLFRNSGRPGNAALGAFADFHSACSVSFHESASQDGVSRGYCQKMPSGLGVVRRNVVFVVALLCWRGEVRADDQLPDLVILCVREVFFSRFQEDAHWQAFR
ncbi:unnamed protein product, partial [Sphacelaria rigidula]